MTLHRTTLKQIGTHKVIATTAFLNLGDRIDGQRAWVNDVLARALDCDPDEVDTHTDENDNTIYVVRGEEVAFLDIGDGFIESQAFLQAAE